MDNKSTSETSNYILHLSHLSKTYHQGTGTRLILDDVSLGFQRGEVIAVLGKSGSGKTTLLNLISGIDQADAGEVFFDSINLTAMDDHQRTLVRRKRIGFVFQFFNLIPTLTIWENTILPLELNQQLKFGGKERAEDLLNQVSLLDRKNAYPEQLSGGEQQRVSIARALVHQPDLVLADEPTGNLDEQTGAEVLQLLNQLTRGNGRSLILVTHSLAAARIADRVFYLHQGKMTEEKILKPEAL
jgi:putative ABC transport system ATP-binding protein